MRAYCMLAMCRENLFLEAQKAFPEAAASYQALKDTPLEDRSQPGATTDTETPAT